MEKHLNVHNVMPVYSKITATFAHWLVINSEVQTCKKWNIMFTIAHCWGCCEIKWFESSAKEKQLQRH